MTDRLIEGDRLIHAGPLNTGSTVVVLILVCKNRAAIIIVMQRPKNSVIFYSII